MPEYLLMLKAFTRELGLGVIVVLAAFLVSRLLRRVINTLRDTQNLSPMMARRLQTFRHRAVLLITVLILMQALGVFDNAWAFISAVALGFVAAWSILSNATAAALVLTFRPFRMGDTVELLDPTGEPLGGTVLDMNLMYTTLSAPSSTPPNPSDSDAPPESQTMQLHIPNNLFFQRVLRTRSRHDPNSKATFFSDPDT
jgi:small-conductance mechanosensitive channel